MPDETKDLNEVAESSATATDVKEDGSDERSMAEAARDGLLADKEVSDLAKENLRALINEEIDKRPKWWQPARWITEWKSRSVVGAIVVSLILGVYAFVNTFTPGLRSTAHTVLGTDAQITAALASMATTGAVGANPLVTLVRDTIEAAPVVIFDGVGSFGNEQFSGAIDPVCLETMLPLLTAFESTGYVQGEASAQTSEDIIENANSVCWRSSYIAPAPVLEIPFFANLTNTSEDAQLHSVQLILHVQRRIYSLPDTESEGNTRELNELNASERDRDYDGPLGLCVMYLAADDNVMSRQGSDGMTGINILSGGRSGWVHHGNGFWSIDIVEQLAEFFSGFETNTTTGGQRFLHSIRIEPIDSEDSKSDDESARRACEGQSPGRPGEIRIIRGLVLVNNDI